MRRIASILLALTLAAAPAAAQQGSFAPPPPIQSTNAVQTCGPVTGTLSAAGQSVALPAGCSGFGTYVITVTTAAGDTPFVGTIASSDATTGGPRRLHKTGVGALQISSDTLTGAQGALEYRTCGGAGPQAVTATAYTSGRATVTIYGVLAPTACFTNGSVQTAEEAALRAGKAFTTTTGNQSVAVGSYLSLTLTNPAGNAARYVIPPYGRVVACDNPSNALLPKFFSVGNATVNPVTTAATVTRRGGASGATSASATYGVATARPDTSPSTSPAVGNPFFAQYAIAQDRTLEPGASTTLSIVGVTTGLTGTPTCSILISWYEESTS